MNEDYGKVKVEVDNLKLLELKNRQGRVKHAKGFIKHISPQGDKVYVTVQRPPQSRVSRDGSVEAIAGIFFGNEQGYTDEEITMTELLLPLDLDLSTSSVKDYESLLNKEVTVHTINGFPRKVILQSQVSQSRLLTPSIMGIARQSSENRTTTGEGFDQTLINEGYSQEEIDATKKETLSETPIGILDYGRADWNKGAKAQTDVVNKTEMVESGIVTNLPLTSDTSNTLCFKPVKALTAR